MSLNLPATFTYEKRGRIALMTINRADAYELVHARDAGRHGRCFR
jgi:hypothetical protein